MELDEGVQDGIEYEIKDNSPEMRQSLVRLALDLIFERHYRHAQNIFSALYKFECVEECPSVEKFYVGMANALSYVAYPANKMPVDHKILRELNGIIVVPEEYKSRFDQMMDSIEQRENKAYKEMISKR